MARIKFDMGELQAFVATAEKASFRLAAEALCLSAPALSRRVERLELALGVRLLERTTRSVELTAIGQEFLHEARTALAGLDAAVQRVSDQVHLRRGRVTIACIPSVASHLLPRVLRGFAVAQPEVQVHVMDESASQVLDAVLSGAADFGLSFTGSQESAVRFEALTKERYMLAMPRSHRWAKRKEVPWAELAGMRLVSVSRDSANRLLLDQATADLPEQPVAWYECNHVAGALALVEGGLGLAVLPQLALPPAHAEVCGVPLSAPDLWRTLGLLQRRDRVLSPAADALRARVKQLHGAG
ncbi:LysR family transcriptional regulator [Acidovorax sp. sif1233]|uniref:LysR family transcriptional regulator n=1 Tax=unclassified Acidovorax TaxID=2684926 RepID=UPI001C47392B|nr:MULTISPECIES: LysR family transcriptional regulator [unclassified Acidovorax]MBV7427511.1 LysR family transcriptional regulator [Acidovorax sp. sif0732]MBV7449871.1 LysR family transcriptional regulator [Acidovorax sp. sif0715]MBV7455528.1 LysR family transcriptional regulator [Acidovorax sp. sif1233]